MCVVCVWICSWKRCRYICVCIHMESRGCLLYVSLYFPHLSGFETDLFHWTWSSRLLLDWLAIKFNGTFCLCFPKARISRTCHHVWIFTWILVIWIQVFMFSQLLYQLSHLLSPPYLNHADVDWEGLLYLYPASHYLCYLRKINFCMVLRSRCFSGHTLQDW